MVRIEEVTEDEPTTVNSHGRVGGTAAPERGPSFHQRSSGSRGGSRGPATRISGTRSASDAGQGRGPPDGLSLFGPAVFMSAADMGFGPPPHGQNTSVGVVTITSSMGPGHGIVHMISLPTGSPIVPPVGKPRPPVVQTLNVPLDMLYKGGTVQCCVKSQATDTMGPLEPERTKTFEVDIEKGYQHGTQIKFDKSFPDDELYLGEPKVDVTFVVEEEKHKVFKRKGQNLYCDIKLGKEELMAESFIVDLMLLSGRIEQIPGSRATCRHGTKRTLKGLGMPIRREGRATNERGDLTIKFVWPLKERTSQQCCVIS